MLSLLISSLVGIVLGAWGSLITWSLGAALVVVACVIFVVATSSSWLVVPGSIVAYGVGMLFGLLVGRVRRARRLARSKLASLPDR